MSPGMKDARDNTQVLLNRFDEVGEIITSLARLVLPRTGEFHSVVEITNEVFEHYYHAKAA